MSWIQQLCKVYDANEREVGRSAEGQRPLRPLFHTSLQAQIELVINEKGELCRGRSRVLTDKQEQATLLPCTEEAASRTSGARAFPLMDNLSYVAGDYPRYTGEQGNFELYETQLKAWCESSYAHPYVLAIYRYIEQRRLITDLVEERLLWLGKDGMLIEKWEGKETKPPILTASAGGQRKAFVRFLILGSDVHSLDAAKPWEDRSLFDSWIRFVRANETRQELCYATGKYGEPSISAPKYIRMPGDSAKLISGNDSQNYTYRGRFTSAEEALSVNREAVEKSHAALAWLISRQGYRNGDQVIVSWRKDGAPTVPVLADSMDLYDRIRHEEDADTGELLAMQIKKALAGYAAMIDPYEPTVIMGLDSAISGKGRLSIFYYQETEEQQLIERVKNWHSRCSFLHTYRKKEVGKDEKGKLLYAYTPFEGAPSPRDIAEAAYGKNVDDKQKKSVTERLLYCIAEGARLPYELIRNLAERASKPFAEESWEARRTLSIACALIRKYHNDLLQKDDKTYEEVWSMYLDDTVNDRSYLFGRILAYVHDIERYAQNDKNKRSGDERRTTNADRLRAAYAQHPAKTLMVLTDKLQPYLDMLKGRGNVLRERMEELIARLGMEDFNNKPLSELYLLGYACQMNEFYEQARKSREGKEQADAAELSADELEAE